MTVEVERNIKVDGTFLYFTFKDRKPSIELFVDFLYPKLVEFCIPRDKREKLIQKYHDTKDIRYMTELIDSARNLFIKANKTLKRAGEPGELILFMILECFLKAPQIASKMYLKTSEAMPVHGTDGIHIRYSKSKDKLYLYWGESKLYQQLSTSLDEICDSISGFNKFKDGRTPRQRDIDILKSHPSLNSQEEKDELLDYFDPYTKESNKLEERYCCLSGFDFSFYNNLDGLTDDELEGKFIEAYSERIRTAYNLFSDKVKSANLQNFHFHLVLLPFENVAEFRQLFFKKLGIENFPE